MELSNKYVILTLCSLFLIGCSKPVMNPDVKGRFLFNRDVNRAREFRFCLANKGKVKEIRKRGGTGSWSPDGEKIITLPGDILDKKGNFEKEIDVEYSKMAIVWYPDGKSIIFVGDIEKNDMLHWYIVRYYLDNGRQQILYKMENKSYSFYVLELRISPDGNRLIFTAGKTHGTENYIYIINIDGTGLRKLYKLGGAISWYPDSQHIYFETNTDKEGNMINNDWGRAYKMNIDTEELEIVEETIKYPYRGTRVSRDGKYLVYSKPTKEGGSQIMICPIGERTEDKEIPVTYPKFKNGHYTQDTNPDWYL